MNKCCGEKKYILKLTLSHLFAYLRGGVVLILDVKN